MKVIVKQQVKLSLCAFLNKGHDVAGKCHIFLSKKEDDDVSYVM